MLLVTVLFCSLAALDPIRGLATPWTYFRTPIAADALISYTCLVPRTLSSYGDRTFAATGPRLWNSLPVQLRNPDIAYGLFRRQLKVHLFREAWTRRSVTSDMRRHSKHLLTYWTPLPSTPSESSQTTRSSLPPDHHEHGTDDRWTTGARLAASWSKPDSTSAHG